MFTISNFTNPTFAQGALTNISAATTKSGWWHPGVLDQSWTGTYPAISAPEANNFGFAHPTVTPAASSNRLSGDSTEVLFEKNWFALSFMTKHLCSQQRVTNRDCLLNNATFSSGLLHKRHAH
jgi:hypothetical protein